MKHNVIYSYSLKLQFLTWVGCHVISVPTFYSRISKLELDCKESRVSIKKNHKNITEKKQTSVSYLSVFSSDFVTEIFTV